MDPFGDGITRHRYWIAKLGIISVATRVPITIIITVLALYRMDVNFHRPRAKIPCRKGHASELYSRTGFVTCHRESRSEEVREVQGKLRVMKLSRDETDKEPGMKGRILPT